MLTEKKTKRKIVKIKWSRLITLGVICLALILGVWALIGGVTKKNAMMEIETPYCSLYYPKQWKKQLRIETNKDANYEVLFVAEVDGKEQNLFSFYFGESQEQLLGVVTLADGTSVDVSFKVYEFVPDETWTQDQIETVYMMQEDVNYTLEQMPLEQSYNTEIQVEETEPSEEMELMMEAPDVQGSMDTKTSYVSLQYPAKWDEYVCITYSGENNEKVIFGCVLNGRVEQHMFTVCFGLEEGEYIGEVKDSNGNTVSVSVIPGISDLPDDWNEAEKDLFYAMQEDVNYVIENLPLV